MENQRICDEEAVRKYGVPYKQLFPAQQLDILKIVSKVLVNRWQEQQAS